MVSLDLSITHFTGFSECLQPTNRRWSGQSHENLSCGNLDWHFHRQWEGEAFPCVPCLCWSSSQTSSLQLLYVCLFCHAPDICRHHYCVWRVALGVTRWAPTVTLDKTNIKFSQAQIKGGMDDKEWEMGCGVRGGRGMVRLGWKHPEQIVSREGGARQNRPWSLCTFFRCQNLCLGEVCSWVPMLSGMLSSTNSTGIQHMLFGNPFLDNYLQTHIAY